MKRVPPSAVNDASAERPIGVFDSGLGGLTVARALIDRLPGESLLYVGDTARVPYGPKSPETVRRYAEQIASWLVSEGVKAIVVACNTATAHALGYLQQSLTVPVIGVVDPGARAAVQATPRGSIGVIGTAGTIASGAYDRAIHALAPDVEVFGHACPLFVPLVEEGWVDHDVTRIVANEYLQPLRARAVSTVVLGCTHYPLLAPVIAATLGDDVRLIDSAEETAAETARTLSSAGLLTTLSIPRHRWVASDAPERFHAMGRRFLHDTIDAVEHVPFG